MGGEIAALGEALTAFVAVEGFLARVRPAMDGETAALGKALTTLVAAEGFLARVRPAMDGETEAGGKVLTALVAAEGFLARVRPAMDGERAALGKTLTALVAAEGFLARVRPAMDGERAALGKALAALVAAEGFLARVRPAMLGESTALRKALATLVAAEGFLARVNPMMAGESAALGKTLAALVAAEGFLARVRPAMDGESVAAGKALAALVAAVGLAGLGFRLLQWPCRAGLVVRCASFGHVSFCTIVYLHCRLRRAPGGRQASASSTGSCHVACIGVAVAVGACEEHELEVFFIVGARSPRLHRIQVLQAFDCAQFAASVASFRDHSERARHGVVACGFGDGGAGGCHFERLRLEAETVYYLERGGSGGMGVCYLLVFESVCRS
jgi:hypothetical protein